MLDSVTGDVTEPRAHRMGNFRAGKILNATSSHQPHITEVGIQRRHISYTSHPLFTAVQSQGMEDGEMYCAGQRLIYQMFTEPLPMPGIGPWAGHWDKEPVLTLEEHTVTQKRRAKSTVPALQGDRGSRSEEGGSQLGSRWGGWGGLRR